MSRLVPVALALLLAGCTSLPGRSGQPSTSYVLTSPGPVVHATHTNPAVLLLRDMDASTFYQSPSLAFSREPGTRAHYQFAKWTELPAKRLTWLLRQRLETAGVFATVAPLGAGVVGEYQLNTRLIDFYHDASSQPGSVFLIVEAELVRRAKGTLVAHQAFVAQQPVATFDAAGAAAAMDRAANQVIDEIAVWLEQASG
jgi:cholesterol transport system auxiliary component